MSDKIDYSTIRKMTIDLAGLKNMDDTYTFFYDETNNCRVFRITEKDFNSSKDEDFVLGGLVYEGAYKEISTDDLMASLRLQPRLKEIKRKNIATGNTFLECMKSKKLQTFLEWLIQNKLYIHFMAMNNLYFGIVDIVDSLVADNAFTDLPESCINLMKNVIYKYINMDIDYIHKVFLNYNYPNIANENVRNFCDMLIEWIEQIEVENVDDNFALESVRQLLNSSREKERLCFLRNNENLMLMDGFESLYIEPIYMFPNSQHIFDEETEIIEKMRVTPVVLNGRELHNFSFVKSTKNKMVQFSDVIVGIIGKLMLYANVSTLPEIWEDMTAVTSQQRNNIFLLNQLINVSSIYNQLLNFSEI